MESPQSAFLKLSSACAISSLLCACATHLDDTREIRSDWARGDYSAASSKLSVLARDNAESADALVWRLDEGLALRAAGRFPESMSALDSAFTMVEAFEASSEIDLGYETKALFTNLSYLPYTGYNYDRIMLGVYQTLNSLETGKIDDAAVMLKRVENFQKNAEKENSEAVKKSIENAQKVSGKKDASTGDTAYNYNKAMENGNFRRSLKSQYGDAAVKTSVSISDRGLYVNPFAYWLDGIYFTICGKDSADRTRAVDSLRLASEMVSSKFLDEDFKIAQKVSDGEAFEDRTYLIFETGCAPKRNQIRIDIPLFIATKDVPYVGAAFPKLEYDTDWSANLPVVVGGKSYNTEILADMDAIIKREFDDLLPMVIAKTLMSAGTKAAAQYGLQEAARQSDNEYVLLATIIMGSIYQASMNDADLRCWVTLPKQIRVASFSTPKNLSVKVGTENIKLENAKANFICVRRTGINSKISVSTFSVGKR